MGGVDVHLIIHVPFLLLSWHIAGKYGGFSEFPLGIHTISY